MKSFASTLSIFVLSAALFLSTPLVSAAGSTNVQLVANASEYSTGAEAIVTVNIVSTDAVLGGEVYVQYDTNALEYVKHDSTGTAFNFGPEDSVNSGVIKSVKVSLDVVSGSAPRTGTNKFVSLHMKMKATSGQTTMRVVSPTKILASSDGTTDTWNGTQSSVTLGVKSAPAPAPAPAQPPKNQSQQNNQSTSSGAQPLTASGSPVTAPSSSTTAVENTTASDVPVPVVTNPVIDSNPGFLLSLTLLKKDGSPIANQKAVLAGQTSQTNDEGVAEFVGVRAGEYEIVAGDYTTKVVVNSGDPAQVQTGKLTLDAKKASSSETSKDESDSNSSFVWIVFAVAGLLLVVFAVLFIRRSKFPPTGTPTVQRRLFKRKSMTKGHSVHQPQAFTPGQTSPAQQAQPQQSSQPTDKDLHEYLKPAPPSPTSVIQPTVPPKE